MQRHLLGTTVCLDSAIPGTARACVLVPVCSRSMCFTASTTLWLVALAGQEVLQLCCCRADLPPDFPLESIKTAQQLLAQPPFLSSKGLHPLTAGAHVGAATGRSRNC